MPKIGSHYFSLAVDYAGLVGKYIRMERYSTPEELEEAPDLRLHGMECTVAAVYDTVDGKGVEIVSDYGMSFAVYPELHEWRFNIWPDEETRGMF
jgi:hypothetical protein